MGTAEKMDAFDDPFDPVFSPRKATTPPCPFSYSIPAKNYQSAAWFDIRVFYIRVSSCYLEDAPDVLTMRYFPKNSNTAVEVNGGRISYNVCPFLTLKRDRMDKESVEVTYVTTDNLRTSSDLAFKVFDKDDLLICGSLKKVRSPVLHSLDINLPSKGSMVDLLQEVSNQHGWTMECTCAMGSSKCSFTRKRPMFSTLTCPPPCVEVYLAGRVSDLPVVLTESVKLIARRKYLRSEIMETIAEDEDELLADSSTVDKLTQGSERCEALVHMGVGNEEASEWDGFEGEKQGSFCAEHDGLCSVHEYAYLDGEEGQLSWFKAGVRVGVGIGLGICLGLGIGVGVLVRAYQSTTRTFSSRTFRKKFI